MQTSDLTIRSMSLGEVDLAIDWATAEGWNPGLFDAAPFYAADPEGFLIGQVGDEPVAVISAVKYGDTFGFIGFYIVRPAYRGQGYGWAIWQAAMARLAGRRIGLDGVPEQQDNYRRCGFRLAHRNVRYQGTGGGAAADRALSAGERLLPLSLLPDDELENYDASFFPARRSAFLRSWIAQPQTVALGLLRTDRLIGYGVLRACRNGHKIGPLFADTPEAAEALFCALSTAATEETAIFLDVPACNPAAIALAKRHGMEVMFETARMYAGPPFEMAMSGTYGITSFELG